MTRQRYAVTRNRTWSSELAKFGALLRKPNVELLLAVFCACQRVLYLLLGRIAVLRRCLRRYGLLLQTE